LPRPGETCLSHGTELDFGGKGANQAVQAARILRKDVTFISKVGQDASGNEMVTALQKYHVDTQFVTLSTQAPTGTASIVVDPEGRNMIVVNRGANALLCKTDIVAASTVLSSAALVVCQLEAPLKASLAAFHLAGDGALKILNTAPIPSTISDDVSNLLNLADILCPNEIEAEQLTGLKDEEEAALRLLEIHPNLKAVVVTLGPRGCILLETGQTRCVRIEADHVKAVDTVGAGDSFVGSFSAALALGYNLETSCKAACKAATYSVLDKGTMASS